MVIQMVKNANKTDFESAYLLVDAWFVYDNFMFETQKIKT